MTVAHLIRKSTLRGMYDVTDEDGKIVAITTNTALAKRVQAALELVATCVERFPGLENGVDDVPGADLVDTWNELLAFDDQGNYFLTP